MSIIFEPTFTIRPPMMLAIDGRIDVDVLAEALLERLGELIFLRLGKRLCCCHLSGNLATLIRDQSLHGGNHRRQRKEAALGGHQANRIGDGSGRCPFWRRAISSHLPVHLEL